MAVTILDLDWWEIPLDAALMTDRELRVELDQILTRACRPRSQPDYPRLTSLMIEWCGRRHGGTCPPWPADRPLPYRRIPRRQPKGTAA